MKFFNFFRNKKQSLNNSLVTILTELIYHCINIGKLPTEWKSTIFTPLYKNKGALSDFNNYRGISVLPPIVKIF